MFCVFVIDDRHEKDAETRWGIWATRGLNRTSLLVSYIYSIYTTLHYLPYTTLPYTTLHYLPYTTYPTLSYTTLPYPILP